MSRVCTTWCTRSWDNSIDEALAGYCTDITVTIHPGNTITVTDNGRGIPVDIQPQTGRPALEVVFTVLHAGGNSAAADIRYPAASTGVGASVVNALSEWLEVQVHKNGEIYEMKFSRGKITQEMKVVGRTDHTGTTVTFKPDPEMFDTPGVQLRHPPHPYAGGGLPQRRPAHPDGGPAPRPGAGGRHVL